MRKPIILMAALAILAVVAGAIPAAANHAVPVTITVQSTYAGVCGGRPGPNNTIPAGFTSAINANRLAGGNTAIPADLGSGPASAACGFGADPLWTAATPRHLNGTGTPAKFCNATNFADCAGVHLPGLGAPTRPGRFLNFAISNGLPGGSGLPDPKNECRLVSSAAPFAAACNQISLGYFEQGDSTLGGYCGSSEGFFWTITSVNSSMTESASTPWDDVGFTIAQWKPNSAGSILPITGSTAGTNWATKTGHYGGVTSTTPGARDWSGTRNVFALSSARSYVAAIDNEPTDPGSCSGTADFGGKQFLNQSVAIALGD